jgi:hypothetical protein
MLLLLLLVWHDNPIWDPRALPTPSVSAQTAHAIHFSYFVLSQKGCQLTIS